MFLPIFIALLLGLINPSHTNNCNGGGTVYVNSTNDDPNDPGDGEDGGDDDGEDDGNDGPGGPTGDNGQLPPPKP
jgi:hypothetical protein